jgi:hypothetical protein
MKKLPSTVGAFNLRGRSYSPPSRSARPMAHRIRGNAGALVCRWQRDLVSRQLRWAWSFEDAERALEERQRLTLTR